MGRAIAGRRDQLVVATKFGIVAAPFGGGQARIDGSTAYARNASNDQCGVWASTTSTCTTRTGSTRPCRSRRRSGGPSESDHRRGIPWYSEQNIDQNLTTLDIVRGIAAELDASAGQVAVAWLLAKGPDVVPIPGTRRPPYFDQNTRAPTSP